MSAQDLEQRAHEVEWATRSLRELWEQSNKGWEAQGAVKQLESFIVAALRQQPAPAELSEVTRQLIERDRRGRAKYGTSLDRTDLSLPDWLQHMAEELLDAAGYALAAKRMAQQPAAVVGDAMRELIVAAEHYMEVRGSTHGQPARERLRAALARAQGVQS